MMDLSTDKVERSILLNASPENVWQALTDPEQTRKFMFNAAADSDWQVGSAVTWKGNYMGYETAERGVVINAERPVQLKYSSFDPNFGLVDIAENYLVITYDLRDEDGSTRLDTTIENFNGDPDRCGHIAKGWDEVVLPGLHSLFP
ncbi:MAG: SRPBCC domain-containing protein [Chitinophagaceae bacterium]|nr:MAG: SRPBCC domain-containing protein [Chitinophagaceae bacterium]